MKTFAKLAAAAAIAVSFFAAPAQAASTRELLAHADATVTTLRHDSVFGDARHNLRGARAVLIFPSLVKGGFIFGAEGGDGVLLRRSGRGWSSPAFYSMGSASFGFQVAMRTFAFFRRRARLVTRIGGAMLICVGLLEVTGAWFTFMDWLQAHWVSSYQPPI